MLFPKDPVSGLETIHLCQYKSKPFKLVILKCPNSSTIENADRQPISHEIGHYSDKLYIIDYAEINIPRNIHR